MFISKDEQTENTKLSFVPNFLKKKGQFSGKTTLCGSFWPKLVPRVQPAPATTARIGNYSDPSIFSS